jgi:hypothetical protein
VSLLHSFVEGCEATLERNKTELSQALKVCGAAGALYNICVCCLKVVCGTCDQPIVICICSCAE